MLLLKTFGGLAIVVPDGAGPAGAATQRRRLALLAVLAAGGEAGVTREKLLGLFWPDLEEERARAALAQALYALKQGLGSNEIVVGTASLRLNAAVLASDVGRFRRAVAERRWADAAECWTGPFLDGVALPGLDEFERWAEHERTVLTREAVECFERLAREAQATGDHTGAVRWWQRRAAADPLAAAGAVGLMEALAAAGDRAAALRHARLYEGLVTAQLDLPPDPAVVTVAERLRAEPVVPAPAPPPSSAGGARDQGNGADATGLAPSAAAPALSGAGDARSVALAPAAGRWRGRLPWLAGAAAGALLVTLAGWTLLGPSGVPTARADGAPLVAVGAFGAFGAELEPAARALTDMVATSLAQVPGLNVVSSSRIYELAARAEGDTARALLKAARAAGATDLIDGAVYRVDGGVRLDLRRSSLVSGEVTHAVSVTAPDVFAAVDSGTAHLRQRLGGSGPGRPLADVTTSSLVAYRLYVEGLRAFHEGQGAAAFRLFSSALAEDSSFAMAAYYAALSGEGSRRVFFDRLARALQSAEHAGDRERLLIRSTWAEEQDDPGRIALAETLVTRYASEPFAHLQYGRAMVAAGRFGEALVSLRAAIALDRGAELTLAPGRCVGCEARAELAALLRGLDSLRAAEREARAMVRVEDSHLAWHVLAEALIAQGRRDDALDAVARAGARSTAYDVAFTRAVFDLRAGAFASAGDELLRRMRSGNARDRSDAAWWLHFLWRAQGRLDDALEVSRTLRAGDSTWGQRGAAPYIATAMAATLYEQGRYRAAAALWDSIAQLRTPGVITSRHARHRAWFLTLAATAHAAADDTTGLAARADTVEVLGRQSAYVRDQRLHHHVRGLLYQARGRHAEAAEAFRRAVYMPAVGYSRTQQALARSLAALGRHDEAIVVLRPLLGGPLDGSNTYLPLTEVREQLAELFAAAGRRDSAAVYAASVVEAWSAADPLFAARRRRMEDLARR